MNEPIAPPTSQSEIMEWYRQQEPLYNGVCKVVATTLKSLLATRKIDYLDVTHRTKALDDVIEKISRKQYKDPKKEITDIAGIRVIAFIESDVDRISELVKNSFNIHPEATLDKLIDLGVDRTGYRSVHFVCDLGVERTRLPEFSPYKDMTFEIQVRTVLQHAWAEIVHDRNYKLSGVLPKDLQRRFYILAGVLELVDSQFDSLAAEFDRFSGEVTSKTQAGDLNIELSSTSVLKYFVEGPQRIQNAPIDRSNEVIFTMAITELLDFGIATIAELDKLVSDEYIDAVRQASGKPPIIGFLRGAMMFSDIDKYFSQAWKKHFQGFTPTTNTILANKYGSPKIDEIVSGYFKD